MDNEIGTWLFDILQSIPEIDSYFEGRPQRFGDYTSDIRTKRAVERNIEIIGEAVNRILKRRKTKREAVFDLPLDDAPLIAESCNRFNIYFGLRFCSIVL